MHKEIHCLHCDGVIHFIDAVPIKKGDKMGFLCPAHSYDGLAKFLGWKLGVHKAPHGYEHPWLVVFADRTDGATSRADARQWWSYRHKDGRAPDGQKP